jgi:hypothetical protein
MLTLTATICATFIIFFVAVLISVMVAVYFIHENNINISRFLFDFANRYPDELIFDHFSREFDIELILKKEKSKR